MPEQDDRKEIRRLIGLHQEIREELSEAAKKPERGSVWGMLNSPFIVTLLGGALIAAITAFWETQSSYKEQVRALEQQQYQRKVHQFTSFSKEVQTNVTFYSKYLKDRQSWLREHKSTPAVERPLFREVYKYDEVVRAFDDDQKIYFEMIPLEGQFGLVRGTFTTCRVQEVAKELEKIWEEMRVEEIKQDQFRELSGEFQTRFRTIIEAMAVEINHERTNLENKFYRPVSLRGSLLAPVIGLLLMFFVYCLWLFRDRALEVHRRVRLWVRR
jgi:hypothetical protein